MMGITEAALKILFLLIPGIIALGIIKSLGPKQPRSDLENALQIFMYGVASYALAGVAEGTCIWLINGVHGGYWAVVYDRIHELPTLNAQASVNIFRILIAIGVATVIAFLVSLARTYGYIHKFLFLVGLTTRQSEVDIWGYTLNSRTIENWVVIRHHAHDKIYQGWISAYSEGGDERELLLTSVTVYAQRADESQELVVVDTIPVLYLGMDRKNVTLEFPSVTEGAFSHG